MSYEIVEFIVNNRTELNFSIQKELTDVLPRLKIWDARPDLQDQFIKHKKLLLLRDLIGSNFRELTPEELMLIDHEYLKFLQEN